MSTPPLFPNKFAILASVLGGPIYNKSVTSVTKIPVIESGTHALGSQTAADIASLLGAAICSTWTGGDLSDITSKGLWVIHFDKEFTSATDLPFDYGDLLHIGSFWDVSNFNIQLAFSNDTGSNVQIKVRRRWGGAFTAWKDLLT